ncbi:response regulator [Actinoplanes sp. NEAU-A12]|uniref:Response regulator n=1 Tax=Actinoplanes sandaracinus TaxID=3045177 RepID=A0ABT6X267_9ACTN|nr:response regulator [Actinoplanes sandaracinus]MDI6105905.1 response regulator [Actinoplanes sandaracinus]
MASTPAMPPDRAGRTVLVVEDEPALARIVAWILTEGGYHAVVANNGPRPSASRPGTTASR